MRRRLLIALQTLGFLAALGLELAVGSQRRPRHVDGARGWRR